MFTGIVEIKGRVSGIQAEQGLTITISNAQEVLQDCHLGDSISCNGVCLTVTHFENDTFRVGVAPETLRKTNFNQIKINDEMNLERAMHANTRFGGHFVQGHVDCTVKIVSITVDPPNSIIYSFQVPEPASDSSDLLSYIVPKGYVCLDGTSLTVIDVDWSMRQFTIMLIEYTQSKVIMTSKKVGDLVNLEVDQMGKYVENTVRAMLNSGRGPIQTMIENAIKKHSK